MSALYGTKAYAEQLKQVKASIRGSENNQRNLSNEAARIAKNMRDDSFSTGEALRASYYRLLRIYNHEDVVAMPTKKIATIWNKAILKAYLESEAPTVDHYMKAQFQWFHAVFRKCPEIKNLATKAAIERANLYVPETSNITTAVVAFKKDVPTLMRNAEKQMTALREARSLTREEVYKQLVIPGLFRFPQEYLDADPVYKRIK